MLSFISNGELPFSTHDRTLHVFDLDGTLVDTHALTVEAYRFAGIDFKPEYWGRSAKDWGCPAEAHKKKQEYFAELLKYRRLPDAWATPLWSKVAPDFRTILTGASKPTYGSIRQNRRDLFEGCFAWAEQSLIQKVEHLYKEAAWFDVVYYEDQPTLARTIHEMVNKVNPKHNFHVVCPENTSCPSNKSSSSVPVSGLDSSSAAS